MTYSVYGQRYFPDSTLIGGTSIYQSLTFLYPVILKAVRVRLIYHNNPSFSTLSMEIHRDGLLHKSSTNSQIKQNLFSQNYAVKETYFEFANINLMANIEYRFILRSPDYSGSGINDAHIAWASSYPDAPLTTTGLTESVINLDRYPLYLVPIYARFNET